MTAYKETVRDDITDLFAVEDARVADRVEVRV
jgi:hypothetical protein